MTDGKYIQQQKHLIYSEAAAMLYSANHIE